VPGIGVVVNPKSRRNRNDPRASSRLARTLGDRGIVREARSIEELARIAEDFKRVGIELLAISGGDGTNHVTLTGFLEVYDGETMPPVALLRGGTMNTLARSVGVSRGRPDELLERLVHDCTARDGRPLPSVERHVMSIVPSRGGRVQRGFLFGTGVVAGFLAEYYRTGNPTPLVAARTLARAIGSAIVDGPAIRRMAQPFHGSVVLDEGPTWDERVYLTVTAGTIADIGFNFKPFYRYREQPSSFHILGIHASALSVVRELPRLRQGKPMRSGIAFDALSRRAVVRSADGRIAYMIDGDLYETPGELEVAIGPRIKLVVGGP
jgi:diacylglycerol kinase (ATP)